MAYGTLTVLDDLSTVNTTVSDFGEDELARRFQQALEIHNRAMADRIGDFATLTGQPLLAYGGADEMVMQELDEFGAADAQKVTGAGNVGFPLRIYGVAVQWTRLQFETRSVAVLARQLDAAAAADAKNFAALFTRALFTPTNTAYQDVNATNLSYSLRALLNADGEAVPNGLAGNETFNGATHTHYLATATFTAANLTAQISTVVEHGVTGTIRIYINRAEEAAVRGFAGFAPYVDQRISQPASATFATGDLDFNDPNNRAIGLFEGAEVWVKPWIPAGYTLVFDTGAGDDKVVAIRTRTGALTGRGAFGMVAEHEHYPLRARQLAREFGMGIFQRHKAAVMRVNNATYSAPVGI